MNGKEAAEFTAEEADAAPRKSAMTAAEINKVNAEINRANDQFWAEQAMRERVAANPHFSDELREQVLKHGSKAIAENLAAPERAAASAFKAMDDARRINAVGNSIEARKHVDRDRRIHDAHAAGRTPKQIEGDPPIRGRNKITASTIRRILKAPRP